MIKGKMKEELFAQLQSLARSKEATKLKLENLTKEEEEAETLNYSSNKAQAKIRKLENEIFLLKIEIWATT
tara:strand:+ start:713 stop:925 length:213 start_codon:yes stop_codon:yes gene_type:complete